MPEIDDRAINITGLILGVIPYLVSLVFLIRRVVSKRPIRQFWRNFLGKPIDIVFTEFPAPQGQEIASEIARYAGGGWLITRGMGIAVSRLLDFCQKQITNQGVKIMGHRKAEISANHVVVVGSPPANYIAEKYFNDLVAAYHIDWHVQWNDAEDRMELRSNDAGAPLALFANLDSNTGHDYTLVIKAAYGQKHDRAVLLIIGCSMYGSQEGVGAVINPAILQDVARRTGNAENVLFVVKTNIFNDHPSGTELFLGDARCIQPLERRAAPPAVAQVGK